MPAQEEQSHCFLQQIREAKLVSFKGILCSFRQLVKIASRFFFSGILIAFSFFFLSQYIIFVLEFWMIKIGLNSKTNLVSTADLKLDRHALFWFFSKKQKKENFPSNIFDVLLTYQISWEPPKNFNE